MVQSQGDLNCLGKPPSTAERDCVSAGHATCVGTGRWCSRSPDTQGELLWWDGYCCNVLFPARVRTLDQQTLSAATRGRSFRSSQLLEGGTLFLIIPETVGGALTLARMGGLDRRVLEMEIISRDFFFQVRPHLRHPIKTNPFYFELLWGGDFISHPWKQTLFLMMSVLLPSCSNPFS